MYIFFFFSSRRRHTRYWRDWSSDVCSSDLISHLGESEQKERIELERERMSHYIFDPTKWPLFEFKALKMNEKTHYLFMRSEEHTSELQSRQYLVCRLLLEKKNKNI